MNSGSIALASAVVVGTGLSYAINVWRSSRNDQDSSASDHALFPTPLDVNSFRKAKLVSSKPVGAGAKLLKFRYESGPGFASNMKPVSHLLIRGRTFDVPPEFPFGLNVERPYTPISASKNEFDLLVKSYPLVKPTVTGEKKGQSADAPNPSVLNTYGLTSRFLLALETGSTVEVRGPINTQPSDTLPDQELREALLSRKFVGMVAAGSGITPMVQILKASPDLHKRKVSLLWSNKSREDVYYEHELDQLVRKSYGALTTRMTLTRMAPAGWLQDTGRVSKEMLRARMPPPGPECIIVVCGPDAFVQAVAGGTRNKEGKWEGPIGGFLRDLEYTNEHVMRL